MVRAKYFNLGAVFAQIANNSLVLAAGVIEASLNKPPANEDAPQGESVEQALAGLMSQIEALGKDIRAPRRKEIIRGPDGRPVASVETFVQPEIQG